MLDGKIIKQITEFAYTKPRTVQEIAALIQKNWRTADRYVEKIIEETGSLAIRTFREGTRGALKIVFYNNIEHIANTEFQERLLQRILTGKRKEDFSPLDIYQYVDPKKRKAFLEVQKEEFATIDQDVLSLFNSAEKSIIIFSGNLSWANVMQGKIRVLQGLAEAAERGVPIKIVTRVDLASLKNLALVQEINESLGREAIEVRHAEQPLRCILIDTKHARFKEVKKSDTYKKGELAENTFIFYDLYDREWCEWIQKVFWAMFRTAIPAQKRVETLKSIQKVMPNIRKA